MRKPSLLTLVAVLIAALWGASLSAMHLKGDIPVVDDVEAALTNVRTVLIGPRHPPDIATIVAIDDRTVRVAGGYPLPRATLAKIVSAIAQLHPRAIAIDMLLVDPGPPDGDQALADALKQGRSIIAGAAVFRESQQTINGSDEDALSALPDARELLLPQKDFTDAAALGFVNVQTDRSGAPRFMPMLLRNGASMVPSFALRVATVASGSDPGIGADAVLLGQRSIPTDIGHLLPLSFYGPRGTVPTISAAAALEGKLDENSIRDRVVVLGATVTGGGDVFPTPFDPIFPGVEVIATAIDHLMAGDGLQRDRTVRLIDAGIAVALPILLIVLLDWRRNTTGVAIAAGVILLWAASNLFAFADGIWLSAALPIATAMPVAILFGATQLLIGRVQARTLLKQSELLQRVHAPGLAHVLARNPDFLEKPVRQDAAVLFIDINGFTGLSETIGATALQRLLDGFYDMVDQVVTESGGVVISFMGDGAMSLFGLPEPHASDAASAVRCCTRLAEHAGKWIDSLPQPISSAIGFKIGAHFGTLVASRLGSGQRRQITTTGDTVNVASRLMEVAARAGMDVAVSNDLLQAAGEGNALSVSGTLSGPTETPIRGRANSIGVWLWKQPSDITTGFHA